MNRYLLGNSFNFISLYLKRHYPALLIFSVTEQCNANCKMCFNHSRSLQETKLDLKEIELISKNSRQIPFLSITGGEPLLVDKLEQIIELFYKNSSSSRININTNGSFPEKTYALVKNFVSRYPKSILRVEVSLDGLGRQHDDMRRTEGLFNKVLMTLGLLCKLKNKYSNFIPEVVTVFSKYNQNSIFELIHYVEDKFNLNHIVLFPRSTKDEGINVSKELYRKIIEYLYHRKRNCNYLYYFLNRLRHKMILDRLKGNGYHACVGGKAMIVLNADGSIEPCEMLREKIGLYKMGNIRDFNYNIQLLLKHKKTIEIRKFIRESKCRCSFESGITAGILSRPSVLVKYCLKALL